MKRILLSIIATMLFAVVAVCQNGPDGYVEFQIEPQDSTSARLTRTSTQVPIYGRYVADPSTLYLNFTDYIGNISVLVVNQGFQNSLFFPSDEGPQPVPISNPSGTIYIIVITSNGQRYRAVLSFL